MAVGIPIVVWLTITGGWLFTAVAAAALGFAAWEYWRIFTTGGYHPSAPVLIGGVMTLILARQYSGFAGTDYLFSVYILVAMAVHIIGFGKGSQTAANDLNITLGGIFYVGWMGAYLISLRNLPDGLFWWLLVIPATWFGDGFAYLVGTRFGKHKMFPRVSPKKTWEGYLGGVIAAALGTMLLAMIWHASAPAVTPLRGLILGLVLGLISPLGDLGESMLKRTFGVKDSSHVIPGHGGVLDRVDSWLWAAPIGYYLIVWAWM